MVAAKFIIEGYEILTVHHIAKKINIQSGSFLKDFKRILGDQEGFCDVEPPTH